RLSGKSSGRATVLNRRSINSAAHGSSCEPLNLLSTSAPRSVQSRQERHRLGIVSLSLPLPRNLLNEINHLPYMVIKMNSAFQQNVESIPRVFLAYRCVLS